MGRPCVCVCLVLKLHGIVRQTVMYVTLNHGGTVVKELCYKSDGRWFDPSWCHWNISLT